MATALTLWAVAAIYTSSMTVAPISLDTDEHFQEQKPWRPSRRSDEDYGVKTETETTPDAEDSAWQEPRYEQREDEEDETETETEARRRFKREPRVKVEEYDQDDQEGFGASERKRCDFDL